MYSTTILKRKERCDIDLPQYHTSKNMEELLFRQVHLDFHTSEKLKNIGSKFDRKDFQKKLQKGYVNSITLFSKCHHGWSYHPTEVNEMHPELTFDLLGEELEACKEIGVRAPVYISAGFDEKEAVRHPEWLARKEDESLFDTVDFMTAGYHRMCFNTRYRDMLLQEIEEVMQKYHPEGIFLDISAVHPCYCAKCRQDIVARGKDIRDMDAVMEQAEMVYREYAVDVEKVIRKYSATCTIFHNAGHIPKGRRDIMGYNTHLELESLPTGGWGYDHFPMSAAYVAGSSMQYLGMTGKFHNTWGEFGGFKHPNALRYETGLSLAFGAKCSIGDQLHPLGVLDEGTYELIGKAYKEVKEKEEWCRESQNCADIGILSVEAMGGKSFNKEQNTDSDVGANRMMLEGKFLYRFLDMEDDFNLYKMLILPDSIRIGGELKEKLQKYIDQGGKILATGVSGLDEKEETFVFDFGAEFEKESDYLPSYMVPAFALATGKSAHVMYGKGYLIRYLNGEVVAERQDAYFNRDLTHFTSHQHTSNNPETGRAAAIINKNMGYIGWNIFEDYTRSGSLHCKELVVEMIHRLLGNGQTITAELPDRAIITLTRQKKAHRYVNHLLFVHTTTRGFLMNEEVRRPIEVIEDAVPLEQVEVKVRVPEKIRRVSIVPQKIELEFEERDGEIIYTVPRVLLHQMIELDYEEK